MMSESPDPNTPVSRDSRDLRINRIIDSISDGTLDHLSLTAKGFFTLTLSSAGVVVAFFWLVGVLYQWQVLELARLPGSLLSVDLTTGVARGYLVLLEHLREVPIIKFLLMIAWFVLPVMFFVPGIFAWSYVRLRPRLRRYLRRQIMIRRSTLRKGIHKHARFYVVYFWSMQKFSKFFSYYVIALFVGILVILPPMMSTPVANRRIAYVSKASMARCTPVATCSMACVGGSMRRHITLIGDSTLTVFKLDGDSYRVVKNEEMPVFGDGHAGGRCTP